MKRCAWAKTEEEIAYHDKEWGKIVYDEKTLFEFLVLEGAQAGLSWNLILKRRKFYSKGFFKYDLDKIVNLSDDELLDIKENSGIIKNKLKVFSVRKNAKVFKEIQNEFGSFYQYLWSFTDFNQIVNNPRNIEEIPVSTQLSETISKDLKKRGMSFVGPTIIYSYLQAVGVVNDHVIGCECK